MKKILFALGLILPVAAFSQNITGDWYGTLTVSGTAIPLVFHIVQKGTSYSGTMDSPKQGAKGLTCDTVTVNGTSLSIVATKYQIKYNGTYSGQADSITGNFTQAGLNLPLNLSRNAAPVAVAALPRRPQDPVSFPYKQEKVSFTNPKAGDILAGTLTMPADGKASKILILVSGSGPQNRDEEIAQFNHRPFLVWSDWLTRNGIAVLRYDDRGVGASTGDYSSATTRDLSDDAEAAVNFILSRPDLNKLSIGIMGHSEGGMIAPMVAARNNHVQFVIMLAGPGIPIDQLMLQQIDDQMRLSGATENARKLSARTNEKVFTLIRNSAGLPAEQLKEKIDTLLFRELRAMPKADLGETNIEETVRQSEVQLASPWYRYFLAFNPSDYLEKLTCPVLALNGTMDMQVNAAMNLKGIATSLQKAGNNHFEVLPLDGLNHLFQKAATGSVAEYAQNTETVNPVALQTVLAWIKRL